eukprot:UN29810
MILIVQCGVVVINSSHIKSLSSKLMLRSLHLPLNQSEIGPFSNKTGHV